LICNAVCDTTIQAQLLQQTRVRAFSLDSSYHAKGNSGAIDLPLRIANKDTIP